MNDIVILPTLCSAIDALQTHMHKGHIWLESATAVFDSSRALLLTLNLDDHVEEVDRIFHPWYDAALARTAKNPHEVWAQDDPMVSSWRDIIAVMKHALFVIEEKNRKAGEP